MDGNELINLRAMVDKFLGELEEFTIETPSRVAQSAAYDIIHIVTDYENDYLEEDIREFL